jgi:hypothetical protein
MYWNVPRTTPCAVSGWPSDGWGEVVVKLEAGGAPGWGGFGQSEVHELNAGLGQHDVAGFQIAMDDASLVGFLQAFTGFQCPTSATARQ